MNLAMETTKAKRSCGACGNAIPKGERCLKVSVTTTHYPATANVCARCLRAYALDTLTIELKDKFGLQQPKASGFADDGTPVFERDTL